MGKIFGISDLPISTIMTALEETRVPEPVVRNLSKVQRESTLVRTPDTDVVKSAKFTKSNPIIRLRQGFGKLMNHFSKVVKTK